MGPSSSISAQLAEALRNKPLVIAGNGPSSKWVDGLPPRSRLMVCNERPKITKAPAFVATRDANGVQTLVENNLFGCYHAVFPKYYEDKAPYHPYPRATYLDFQHPGFAGGYCFAIAIHVAKPDPIILTGFDGGTQNLLAGQPCHIDWRAPSQRDYETCAKQMADCWDGSEHKPRILCICELPPPIPGAELISPEEARCILRSSLPLPRPSPSLFSISSSAPATSSRSPR